MHAEVDTLSSPPNWQSIAADVNNWLVGTYINVLSNKETFDQLVVTDENYPGSTFGQGAVASGSVGSRSVSAEDLSPALCLVASLKTNVVKRYARGHIFFPPAHVSTATQQPGGWSNLNAYWVNAKAFLDAFKAGHVAGSTSYVPEIFSRHQVELGHTPFAFPITAYVMRQDQRFLRTRISAP